MLLMMLVLLMGTGMTSCEFFNDNPVSPRLKVRASSMTIQVGTSRKCNVSASTRAKLLYASNNESIATVDDKGIVTGVSEGDAIITVVATNQEGSELFLDESAVIAVKVVAKDSELTEEEQQIAEAVALIEEAQEEGSEITLLVTLDGVEYPITFKMENGQFVLQTAAGTRGSGGATLTKYDISLEALPRTEADEKQEKDIKKINPDPAYKDGDDLFDNGTKESEPEYVGGSWTDEEEKALMPGNEMDIKDIDANLLDEMMNSKAEYPAEDTPDASLKADDPILNVTVKEKASGNTVLTAQLDPATYSLTQTGASGISCGSTVTVNKKTRRVSTKETTCTFIYPDGKVKSLHFNSEKYKTWEQLVSRYKDFGKISGYVFSDNYWVCETDGKTIVTKTSEIKPTYHLCHKVSVIGFNCKYDVKRTDFFVGDKFRVEVTTAPDDALSTGVFGVKSNKNVSIERVKGKDNVFDVTCMKKGNVSINFFYQDYGKKISKALKVKIKPGSVPEDEQKDDSDDDTPTQKDGDIAFTEAEHSVTWSATAANNTYTQTVNNTGDGPVNYSISHNTCGAKIDPTSGQVTFTQVGSVMVTAKVDDTDAYTYKTKEVSYTLTVNKANAEISFQNSSETKTYGDAKFTNTLSNSGDGTVKYSSDKTSVAVVNESSGEVEIKGVGTATITATVSGAKNYQYAKDKIAYTLTVNPKGTLSDYDKKTSEDW